MTVAITLPFRMSKQQQIIMVFDNSNEVDSIVRDIVINRYNSCISVD